MLGRAFTSVIWGLVADRYGRKPVILIGTASVLVVILHLFLIHLSFAFSFISYTPNALNSVTGSFSILCLA